MDFLPYICNMKNKSEETLVNDELIVNFMGVKSIMLAPDAYTYSDGIYCTIREDNPEKVMKGIIKYVKYATSWEWLMPVVHKCLAICHERILNEWEASFADKFMACSLKSLYDEVIAFIKFYNQNK